MKRRRKFRRRSPWGRLRRPDLTYMHAWEREVILRDIRSLAEKGVAKVSADTLVDQFPGAYRRPKLKRALERLRRERVLEADGTTGWGRRQMTAYRLMVPTPKERAA
jgi:hypothetical protein